MIHPIDLDKNQEKYLFMCFIYKINIIIFIISKNCNCLLDRFSIKYINKDLQIFNQNFNCLPFLIFVY